ncbi:MAG: DNA starvation/stationary phase protection protein [Sebaldella sp.]|nr:DNA starvation/stationary phase protection protein [Sebaldella sp.]
MSKVNEKMNVLLADLNVLYRKVQNYHWNVDGRNFFTIHAKLEEYYNEINEQIDEIAERILSIKARPYATMKKYLEITNIKEAKDEDIIDLDIVKNLKADFETILGELKDIKREADKEEDFGTSAMMDELIIGYETKLWMLGAFLKQ